MRVSRLAGLGVFVLTSSSVAAQTLNIDHQPVGCAVAEKFPRLEARFAPEDTVATARVFFQGENLEVWYAVAMTSMGPAFTGFLPKPRKSLKTFRYYIEVTDKSLGTHRTEDYTTNVVASSGECKGKLVAATVGSASVVLQVPAGAAALPAGFASTGVLAAGSAAPAAGAAAGGGGGLSTGAVLGIAAGVGGAAAVGAAVAGGKGGAESNDRNSATSYTGPLAGQLTLTQISTGMTGFTTTCSFVHAVSGTMQLTLEETNGTLGRAEISVTEALLDKTPTCNGSGPGCCGPSSFRCALTGTSGDLRCSAQQEGADPSSIPTLRFSGALNGGVISGTVTYGRTGSSGPGSNTHTGSTTFPVTLR